MDGGLHNSTTAQQHRLNAMYGGIYKKEQVEEQMKEQLE